VKKKIKNLGYVNKLSGGFELVQKEAVPEEGWFLALQHTSMLWENQENLREFSFEVLLHL